MPIDTKSATSINGLTRDDDDDNTPPPALLSSPQKPLLPKPVEDPEIVRIRSLPIETIDLEEELQRSDSRHHRYHTDPLADGVYVPAHLTAERLETRGKNIERDLLAHNSHRIRGDLEKLNSPDWIKAIGLSPALVASCSKKELEQRKVPLIAHLESTLEKYNAWSKDLKRKKNGRTSTSPKESQERDGSQETEEGAELGSQDESDNEHHRSGSRRRTSTKRSRPSSMSASISKLTQKKPARLEVEFTSFYDKPYMREQALSKWRKSSRTQTAFGQPLPVIAEKEFELPEELFASAAAARQSRARKRLSR